MNIKNLIIRDKNYLFITLNRVPRYNIKQPQFEIIL